MTFLRLKRYALVLVTVLAGVFLTKIGWGDLETSRRLSREGITVPGKVVSHAVFHRAKGRDRYSLSVSFQPATGQPRFQVFDVSSDVYSTAVASRTISIRYLPGDPTTCVAGDTVRLQFGNIVLGFAVIGGGLFFLWFFRFARVQVQNLCVPVHEFATVDAGQYQVDHAFYENGQQLLTSRGYRFLGDCEDLTFRKQSGLRIPIRTLASGDGVTAAGLYHFRPRWIWRAMGGAEAKVLDLETQFADGRWLVTTNATLAGALNSPPAVDSLHLPARTPLLVIADTHTQRLVQFLRANPGVQPVRFNTLDDIQRAQADLQRIKAAHRQAAGLSKDELERIAGVTPSVTTAILHDGIKAAHEGNKRAV